MQKHRLAVCLSPFSCLSSSVQSLASVPKHKIEMDAAKVKDDFCSVLSGDAVSSTQFLQQPSTNIGIVCCENGVASNIIAISNIPTKSANNFHHRKESLNSLARSGRSTCLSNALHRIYFHVVHFCP